VRFAVETGRNAFRTRRRLTRGTAGGTRVIQRPTTSYPVCTLCLDFFITLMAIPRDCYLYAIKKDGADLCATEKVIRTYVTST
jgi:hypothetical protein